MISPWQYILVLQGLNACGWTVTLVLPITLPPISNRLYRVILVMGFVLSGPSAGRRLQTHPRNRLLALIFCGDLSLFLRSK